MPNTEAGKVEARRVLADGDVLKVVFLHNFECNSPVGLVVVAGLTEPGLSEGKGRGQGEKHTVANVNHTERRALHI